MSPRARRFFGCILPLTIALAGCGGMLLMGYAGQVFLQAVEIEDAAMAPLIEPGETVIVDNTIFWADQPGRSTVVSVAAPDGSLAIRHLVGTPGDTLSIQGGKLHLDGTPCDGVTALPGGRRCWFAGEGDPPADFGPITLGEDEYFVLAERWDAADSRTWGPLSRSDIYGFARFSTRDMTDIRNFETISTAEPPR